MIFSAARSRNRAPLAGFPLAAAGVQSGAGGYSPPAPPGLSCLWILDRKVYVGKNKKFENELTEKIAEFAGISPKRVRRRVPLVEIVGPSRIRDIVSFLRSRTGRFDLTSDSEMWNLSVSDIVAIVEQPTPAEALLPREQVVGLTDEALERLTIVLWVLDGHTIQEASGRFNCHRQTIATWLRRYQDKGPAGLNPASRKHSKIHPVVRQLVRQAMLEHPEWSKRPLARWLAGHGHKLPLSTVHHVVHDVEPRIHVSEDRRKLLYFHFAPHPDETRRWHDVRVTGDFLQWSPHGVALELHEGGNRAVAFKLPPGDYRCRFIVDGSVIMVPYHSDRPRGAPLKARAFEVPPYGPRPVDCEVCHPVEHRTNSPHFTLSVVPSERIILPPGTPIHIVKPGSTVHSVTYR